MKKIVFIIIGLIGIGLISCSDDFLEPGSHQTKPFEEGVETTNDLHNLVKGIYSNMNTAEYYGRDMIVYGEIRSDNTNNDESTGRYINVGRLDMLANDEYALDTWYNIYQCIQLANIAIDADVTGNDPAKIDYHKGQAYTLRALFYFDLLRLYSTIYVDGYELGVPLVTEFDKTGDADAPGRSSITDMKQQIEDDFQMALNMMDPGYDGTKTEITVDAAKALYSRYLLYEEKTAEAMNHVSSIINSGYELTAAPLYQSQWLNTETNESIFEIAFTSSDRLNTTSVGYMWHPAGYADFTFTDSLLALYESGEARYPYTPNGVPMRYQDLNGTYNIRIIDYPEVILNYVEAAYHEGDPNGDIDSLLNHLATTRGASPYSAATEENILIERRKELAGAGHRYFDLLRTENDIPDIADHISAPIPYGSEDLAFPIPEDEIDANPNIDVSDQN
ncbi:MAG: RagB/SusD family nutrient uptake outer membrane protein, partial [Bacteroidales bacterium]